MEDNTNQNNSEDLQKSFELFVEEKLALLTPEQQASWWDCFVECLARENPAVKNCAAGCATVCLAAAIDKKKLPACVACILGCGGIAWYKIIECARTCSVE